MQALEAAAVPVGEAIIFGSIDRAGRFDTTSDIDMSPSARFRRATTSRSRATWSIPWAGRSTW